MHPLRGAPCRSRARRCLRGPPRRPCRTFPGGMGAIRTRTAPRRDAPGMQHHLGGGSAICYDEPHDVLLSRRPPRETPSTPRFRGAAWRVMARSPLRTGFLLCVVRTVPIQLRASCPTLPNSTVRCPPPAISTRAGARDKRARQLQAWVRPRRQGNAMEQVAARVQSTRFVGPAADRGSRADTKIVPP